jgi:CheY-like chemotaxis protein
MERGPILECALFALAAPIPGGCIAQAAYSDYRRSDPDHFDLAVTGFNMPHMSGKVVATAPRDTRADPSMVLAPAYITGALRASPPAAGMRGQIYKPKAVEDLCAAVARYADAQSANAGSS